MTLMPEVRRLRLHAYLRVCSTELQLQPCTQFFNSSKYGFFRQVIACARLSDSIVETY